MPPGATTEDENVEPGGFEAISRGLSGDRRRRSTPG